MSVVGNAVILTIQQVMGPPVLGYVRTTTLLIRLASVSSHSRGSPWSQVQLAVDEGEADVFSFEA